MGISIHEYEKALKALDEALIFAQNRTDDTEFRIARDACIQRFEFCIELAWKVSAKKLGTASAAAKPVIREMAQNGLIDDPDKWFQFIDARNRTSHSYDENVAAQVFQVTREFISHGKNLARKLSST